MILAWSTSRRTTDQTPPHADFPHTSEEEPTQNSPAATLVLVPLSSLLNSAKVHHRLQDCLFLSFPSWLVSFLFLSPFHPAISNNSMQRSSLLPLCYIPFQELQIIYFIIIIIIIIIFALPKNSSFTFCSLFYCLLHFFFNLSFLVLFCGEFLGTINTPPWLIQRIFLENNSPKFAIFQGKI
jgi:hypothetical protein